MTLNNDVYKSCYGMWVCIRTSNIIVWCLLSSTFVYTRVRWMSCMNGIALILPAEMYIVVAQYVHTELYVCINIM